MLASPAATVDDATAVGAAVLISAADVSEGPDGKPLHQRGSPAQADCKALRGGAGRGALIRAAGARTPSALESTAVVHHVGRSSSLLLVFINSPTAFRFTRGRHALTARVSRVDSLLSSSADTFFCGTSEAVRMCGSVLPSCTAMRCFAMKPSRSGAETCSDALMAEASAVSSATISGGLASVWAAAVSQSVQALLRILVRAGARLRWFRKL